MATSSKDFLKRIAKNFLHELEKLDKSDQQVRSRNFKRSIFLSTVDVIRIETRKKTIKTLFDENIQSPIAKIDKGFISIYHDLEEQVKSINVRIESLTDAKCCEILKNLKIKAESVLGESTKSGDISTHAFNDKWVFTFLAKMIQSINEFLGIKTSSEKLLDESAKVITKQNPSM